MQPFDRLQFRLSDYATSTFGWRISASLFSFAVVILTFALLAPKIHNFDLSSLLLGVALPTLCVALFFLFRFLMTVKEQETNAVRERSIAETSLAETEDRFRQMADNIQEIFWMIDAETRAVLYVNCAFETITGRSREMLTNNPLSYEEIIHQSDRVPVLLKLEEATHTGNFDERFRIVVPNGEPRWVWSRGFPIKDAQGKILRIVGTALDITKQKHAEEELAKNLALTKAAYAEADAMRGATLALTQNLKMDNVLDTLLRSLADLIPYETAQILFIESDSILLQARLAPAAANIVQEPTTLEAAKFPVLLSILQSQADLAISDTRTETNWRPLPNVKETRSWLCVQLVASNRTLGLLCAGHSEPHRFTPEHQRLGKSLAIPAAAAIQNARLYEFARIYGAELEKRTSDLQDAQNALMRFQSGRPS